MYSDCLFYNLTLKKLISLTSKYRKETWIKENECIWQIKTNSNVISEI